jgi:hypothetical protein
MSSLNCATLDLNVSSPEPNFCPTVGSYVEESIGRLCLDQLDLDPWLQLGYRVVVSRGVWPEVYVTAHHCRLGSCKGA